MAFAPLLGDLLVAVDKVAGAARESVDTLGGCPRLRDAHAGLLARLAAHAELARDGPRAAALAWLGLLAGGRPGGGGGARPTSAFHTIHPHALRLAALAADVARRHPDKCSAAAEASQEGGAGALPACLRSLTRPSFSLSL